MKPEHQLAQIDRLTRPMESKFARAYHRFIEKIRPSVVANVARGGSPDAAAHKDKLPKAFERIYREDIVASREQAHKQIAKGEPAKDFNPDQPRDALGRWGGGGAVADTDPAAGGHEQSGAYERGEVKPTVPRPTVEWRKEPPTPAAFIAARENSKHGAFLSPLTVEELKDSELHLSADGKVGYAITKDGDFGNLFNNGGPKGAGQTAVIRAIESGKVKTADCFNGHLPELYANFGLKASVAMKFNDDYAPPGWNYRLDDRPDVLFLSFEGGDPETIADRVGTFGKFKHPNKWSDDYDAAKAEARRRAVAHAAPRKSADYAILRLRGIDAEPDRGSGYRVGARARAHAAGAGRVHRESLSLKARRRRLSDLEEGASREVGVAGTARLPYATGATFDVDDLIEESLARLGGTLDTLDDRLEAVLADAPEDLTDEELADLIDEEFDAFEDDGKIESIAETEVFGSVNGGRAQAFAENDIEWGVWATMEDNKVREYHRDFGQSGPHPMGFNYAKLSDTPETLLRWPHDVECEEPSLVCNCRCALLWTDAPDNAEDILDEELGDIGEEDKSFNPDQARDERGRFAHTQSDAEFHEQEQRRDTQHRANTDFIGSLGIKQKEVTPDHFWSYLDTPKGPAGLDLMQHYYGPLNPEPHVEVNWLHATKRGAGRAAMEMLTAAADKHGTTLDLYAVPLPGIGENHGFKLPKRKLEKFYRGFGFGIEGREYDGNYARMRRVPAKAKKDFDPNQPRDESGKWTGDGGGGGGGAEGQAGGEGGAGAAPAAPKGYEHAATKEAAAARALTRIDMPEDEYLEANKVYEQKNDEIDTRAADLSTELSTTHQAWRDAKAEKDVAETIYAAAVDKVGDLYEKVKAEGGFKNENFSENQLAYQKAIEERTTAEDAARTAGYAHIAAEKEYHDTKDKLIAIERERSNLEASMGADYWSTEYKQNPAAFEETMDQLRGSWRHIGGMSDNVDPIAFRFATQSAFGIEGVAFDAKEGRIIDRSEYAAQEGMMTKWAGAMRNEYEDTQEELESDVEWNGGEGSDTNDLYDEWTESDTYQDAYQEAQQEAWGDTSTQEKVDLLTKKEEGEGYEWASENLDKVEEDSGEAPPTMEQTIAQSDEGFESSEAAIQALKDAGIEYGYDPKQGRFEFAAEPPDEAMQARLSEIEIAHAESEQYDTQAAESKAEAQRGINEAIRDLGFNPVGMAEWNYPDEIRGKPLTDEDRVRARNYADNIGKINRDTTRLEEMSAASAQAAIDKSIALMEREEKFPGGRTRDQIEEAHTIKLDDYLGEHGLQAYVASGNPGEDQALQHWYDSGNFEFDDNDAFNQWAGNRQSGEGMTISPGDWPLAMTRNVNAEEQGYVKNTAESWALNKEQRYFGSTTLREKINRENVLVFQGAKHWRAVNMGLTEAEFIVLSQLPFWKRKGGKS